MENYKGRDLIGVFLGQNTPILVQGNKAEGGRERLKGKGLNQVTRLGGRGPNLLSPKYNLPETHKVEEESR